MYHTGMGIGIAFLFIIECSSNVHPSLKERVIKTCFSVASGDGGPT